MSFGYQATLDALFWFQWVIWWSSSEVWKPGQHVDYRLYTMLRLPLLASVYTYLGTFIWRGTVTLPEKMVKSNFQFNRYKTWKDLGFIVTVAAKFYFHFWVSLGLSSYLPKISQYSWHYFYSDYLSEKCSQVAPKMVHSCPLHLCL